MKQATWWIRVIAVAVCGRLFADTINWAGFGTGGVSSDTSWNAATNWSGGVIPGSADTANFYFPSTPANFAISLDASQCVWQVSFPAYGNEPTLTIGTAADVAAGNTLTLTRLQRLDNVGGTQTLAADVVLVTNSYWDVRAGYGNGVTVSGNMSGMGAELFKAGNGPLTLQGAQNAVDTLKVGGGTLILQGSNFVAGVARVNAGTLTLNFNADTAALTDLLDEAVTLRTSMATVSLSGKNVANVQNSQTVTNLMLDPGVTTFSIANGISSGTTLLRFVDLSRSIGGTANFNQPTVNTAVSLLNGYTTATTNNASGILGGYATIAAADWAANNGDNIVAYTGYATLAGNGPSLADDSLANVRLSNASTGNVTLAADKVTLSTILDKDASPRKVVVGNEQTLRLGAVGGVLTPSGTGVLTFGEPGGTGVLTAGGMDDAAGELVFQNATTVTNNLTVTDNGAGLVALTKSGSGTLLMNTACSYGGGTFQNAGTLMLAGGVNPLATNGSVTITGGTLNFKGAVQTNSATVSLLGGTVTNGTLTKTGTDYDMQSGTVGVTLDGDVGLVKTTPGSVTLRSGATYTGTTRVLEGTLSATAGTLKSHVIVGSPEGGLPASFTTAGNGSGMPSGKNVTVYSNGYFYQGDYPGINNLTIVGGSVGSNWPNIDGGIYMTGGSLSGGPLQGSHTKVVTYACDQTAVISAGSHQASQYNSSDFTYTVADGAAPIDLKVTGQFQNQSTTRLTVKAGSGVLQYTSGNLFNEKTFNINAGTVLIDNASGSGTGKAPTSVNAGATLGGSGFIGGVANYSNANVRVIGNSGSAAVIAPGSINAITGAHEIGTLTVGNASLQTNNVTFDTYSKLSLHIDAAGNTDKLVVNGTLSLATTSDTLELNVADASALRAGTYTLATFQQLGAVGQKFDTIIGLPSIGNIVYTATRIDYVVPPKGTVVFVF